MSRGDELGDVVARLYQEHRHAPFPAGLRGADRADIDMVLLDADIAGCVGTWQVNRGSLDGRRLAILRRRIAHLDQILPLLNEADDPPYWQRLYRLARLVSENGPHPTE